jgi:hypothetical protein
VVAHAYAAAGSYVATLTVTDDDGATDSAEVTVVVTEPGPPPNQLPVAIAETLDGVYTAEVGEAVTLSGSSSYDPDNSPSGGIQSYAWTQVSGPSVALSDPGDIHPEFTPDQAGSYTFKLAVYDGADWSTDASSPANTVTVTVQDSGQVGKLAVVAVVASESQDPNVPANTIDGDLGTRWSALGDPQWIRYDLGSVKTVCLVKVAWYNGNIRKATFDVEVSEDGSDWTQVLAGVQSSGSTLELETYDFADTPARYVRIVGHGNSSNTWNSITETEIHGLGGEPEPPPADGQLAVAGVSASEFQDPNVPANTLDGDLGTRWSAYGDPQWIRYDLGDVKTVSLVKVAWYRGDTRKATFDVEVSSDGSAWTPVLSGAQSSGNSLELETYDFADTSARYVRIVGHGNSSNTWNSITDAQIHGQ